MIAPVFDRLAHRFELVCALKPGRPAVAASDITDLHTPTGRHLVNVRFAAGRMDRLVTSLEHGAAAADRAWLLRHPDHPHDLLIEPSVPPGEPGYLEHSRTLGSRYWVLGAITHATGFGAEAVHQRIDERVRELAADGWTATAIGSEAEGQSPHRAVRRERFLAVAAAVAVSAATAYHNGAVTTTGFGPGCERPWEREPDRAPFTIDADARQWPGEAVRQGDGTWAGYLDLPVGHPWHGHGPGHRDIDEVPIVSGVTSGEPHGQGWRLGFACGGYRPATGWGDPVDYQDLSRVPREGAIFAGHAALTAKAAPRPDGQHPSSRRAALVARPTAQKGHSRGRA